MEEREIRKRTRTYTFTQPTKVIKDGWCHQCKIKNDILLVCVNFWKKKKVKCTGKYCPKCIDKHYDQNIEALTIDPSPWLCYGCQEICSCAVCKRARGIYVEYRTRQSLISKLRDQNKNEENNEEYQTEENQISSNKSLIKNNNFMLEYSHDPSSPNQSSPDPIIISRKNIYQQTQQLQNYHSFSYRNYASSSTNHNEGPRQLIPPSSSDKLHFQVDDENPEILYYAAYYFGHDETFPTLYL